MAGDHHSADPVTSVSPEEGGQAKLLAQGSAGTAMTDKHLRGSSLLLAGRFISLGLNFVVQVLVARYLSETAYGAWAYALSLVMFGETLATLGLDRGASRFLAVYDERSDYARLAGTLLVVLATALSLGLALVALVIGGHSLLGGSSLVGSDRAGSLLVLLIVLSPVQAVDNLMGGVLAVLTRTRVIFWRKYVMGPLLRLVVVLLLVLTSQGVRFLAVGYVLAGVIGVLFYATVLWRALGERGIREYLSLRRAVFPVREILGFTLPLLTTDMVYVSLGTTDALLLQHFWGAGEVADLRVILPLANLNLLVYSSFTMLYLPMASRLHTRDDLSGIADLYWRTALWVAVFSFPVLALTTTLAGPVTVLLYEPRYASSAAFLAIISIGTYVNAAFGFNGLTMRVFGRLRYILVTNVVIVVVNVALNLALIPSFGAAGGAVAMAVTLIAHNVLKQLGLRRTGIDVFDWRYARAYVIIAISAGALTLVQVVFSPPLVVGTALAAVASLAVVHLNRRLLNVASAFPRLLRVPGLRHLLVG